LKKEIDVLVALDTCTDLLIDCGDTEPEFGQKEKPVNGYKLEMGGSGCIFACQCAKLGLKTVGVGMVGNDIMGDIVMEGLKGSQVDTSYIQKSNTISTGLGLALIKNGGDRSILTYMGTIDETKPEWMEPLFKKSSHLHICSYFLQKNMQSGYKKFVRKAKSYGMTISLDTNWDPDEKWDSGINEILPYIDVFLPNENELMYIARCDNIDSALRYLGEMIPTIVIKLGENGAYAWKNGKIYKCEALSVDVADTVGAGDSFDGGFIYGMLSGMSLTECIKSGIICGSMNVKKPGGISGQPDLNTLKHILSQWSSEKPVI